MKFTILLSVLFILLLFTVSALGQVSDTTSTSPVTASDDDFVDLSDQATVIKVEPEKPRVTLITDRIKPQFTDVNLSKSFIKEIMAKSDKALLENKIAPSKQLIIDIEKILNKSR
jgi:hypothetical protein